LGPYRWSSRPSSRPFFILTICAPKCFFLLLKKVFSNNLMYHFNVSTINKKVNQLTFTMSLFTFSDPRLNPRLEGRVEGRLRDYRNICFRVNYNFHLSYPYHMCMEPTCGPLLLLLYSKEERVELFSSRIAPSQKRGRGAYQACERRPFFHVFANCVFGASYDSTLEGRTGGVHI